MIDSIFVDFDGRLNDDVVSMFSSMKHLCPREINSVSCSDEESVVDFDNLISHFRGDISDENMQDRIGPTEDRFDIKHVNGGVK